MNLHHYILIVIFQKPLTFIHINHVIGDGDGYYKMHTAHKTRAMRMFIFPSSYREKWNGGRFIMINKKKKQRYNAALPIKYNIR